MQLEVQVNIQYTLYIVRYVNNNNNNNNNKLYLNRRNTIRQSLCSLGSISKLITVSE